MILLLFAQALAAPLGLDEAVARALGESPAARGVEARAAADRAMARAEGAWDANPELEVEVGHHETRLVVGVPLTPTLGGVAGAARDAAAVEAELARAELAARVAETYLDAVRAQLRSRLADEDDQLAHALADAARARVAAGEWSAVDAALAEADAARSLEEALDARLESREANRALEALIGLPPTGATELAGWPTLAPPPTSAPAADPELRRAAAEADRAAAEARAAAWERLPELTVAAGVDLPPLGGEPAAATPVGGASLEIPLFAPRAAEATAARAARDAAEADRLRVRAEAEARAADALAEREAAARVAAAWDIPGLAEAPEALARRFRSGELSLVDYLAQRDLVKHARESAVDAAWRERRAVLALYALAGAIPTESPR